MKKIGLLCLTLVVALGTLGVGYALWWDTLYISGTVETGDIGLEWGQGDPYDTEIAEKDVSYGECSISGDTLTLTVYDAYPCIEYHFPISVTGTGSVPVHTNWMVVGGTANPDWITFPDWGPGFAQIHQGDVLNGEIVIHLDNTAEQLATYTFSVELDYWQYNEDDEYNAMTP